MGTSEFNGRSILRGLEILQVVNRFRKASSTEIAQVTTIPYPTVCRISNFLAELGMLEYVKDGRYFQPTAMVQSLAGGFKDKNPIVTASEIVLARLCKKFGLPTMLETRFGISMILRNVSTLHQSGAFDVFFPGYTIPMLRCAAGRAYFSFCSDEEREAIIALFERFDAENAAFKAVRAEQKAVLELHREQGFCVHLEESLDNSHKHVPPVSAPIMVDGACVATMSIAIFAPTITPQEIEDVYVPDLLKAAREVEHIVTTCAEASTRPC